MLGTCLMLVYGASREAGHVLVSKCKCVSLKYQLANLAAQEINFKGCALTVSALSVMV